MAGKWHLGFPKDLIDPVPAAADPADPEIDAKVRRNYARSVAYMEDVIGFDEVESLYLRNKEAGILGIPDSLRHHNLKWTTRGALDFIGRNGDKGQLSWQIGPFRSEKSGLLNLRLAFPYP